MTKPTLTMFLGAFCASSWWAFSIYHVIFPPLIVPAIVSSIGVLFLIAVESDK